MASMTKKHPRYQNGKLLHHCLFDVCRHGLVATVSWRWTHVLVVKTTVIHFVPSVYTLVQEATSVYAMLDMRLRMAAKYARPSRSVCQTHA